MRVRAISVSVLLLLGCVGGSGAVLAQVPNGDPPISSAKLNHYVKGFNTLIGTFGLSQEYRLYAAQQISRKTVNAPVNVSDGWIGLGNDELRQGQAIPDGGLPEVDAAAGEMIPILDRLVERLKGLEAYYASRGQLEDDFARGKREDRLVLADFKEATNALPRLDAALERAIDKRDMEDLLALKARGDMIGFNGGLALQNAKRLTELFDDAASVRDPQVIAKADVLAETIVTALGDETTALAEAKAAGDGGQALRNSNYSVAAERLQGLVGTYREMKRSGNPALRPMLVAAYNAAIEEVNIGQ